MRIHRLTLNQGMTQVDLADDDSIAFRSLLIVAQGDGDIAAGESGTSDCTDSEDDTWGLLLPNATEGDAVPMTGIQGNEDVFLATPSGTLEVHIFETGVA